MLLPPQLLQDMRPGRWGKVLDHATCVVPMDTVGSIVAEGRLVDVARVDPSSMTHATAEKVIAQTLQANHPMSPTLQPRWKLRMKRKSKVPMGVFSLQNLAAFSERVSLTRKNQLNIRYLFAGKKGLTLLVKSLGFVQLDVFDTHV